MPSMPRWRPRSPCKWSSRISMAPAATCRSSFTTSSAASRRSSADKDRRRRAPPSRTIAAKGSTWCPAPGSSPPACPARSRPGCCCYATTARPRCARCSPRRSATRSTVIRWSSARAPPSPPLPNFFAAIGRHRQRYICRMATCRRPAHWFTNPALAATYVRILKEAESAGGDRVAQIERARKSWSHGFVAEAIDRFCRTQDVLDTSGKPHRGVLTGGDMARWTPRVEAPLTYDYGRYTVCKTGPWGQGPVMLQQLALLKGFDLDRPRPGRAGLYPFAGRVRQARLCRPRSVLRRP